MNWQDLGAALALFLVLEGVLPFLNPQGVRRLLAMLSTLNDTQLRFSGLTSMLLGLIVLYVVKG